MISEEKIQEIIIKIVKGYDPEKIILFGSYAAGGANENSDLDLFVVKNTEVSRPLRTIQVRKLLFGAMVPIDLVVFSPEEIDKMKNNKYSLVYEVMNSGKIIYERSN
jgi:predicted nucleotidyltransferase